jgi:hypothetical protein
MQKLSEYILPTWAHRVRKAQIERLYSSTAQGLLDEELIDEVGFAFLARCESILAVTQAVCGQPPCPCCGDAARIEKGETTFARCDACGWSCPWELYKKTHQRKGLFAGGMRNFVREFVQKFPAARSHTEKLILIDTLIHRFHWESDGHAGGRPGACNLIEGKMKNIMPFLDRLSYGDSVPPEITQAREEWRRKWAANEWSRGKGQSCSHEFQATSDAIKESML